MPADDNPLRDVEQVERAARHFLEQAHLAATDRGNPAPPEQQQLALQALTGGLAMLAVLAQQGEDGRIQRVIAALEPQALRMVAAHAAWELGRCDWQPDATPGSRR